MNSSLLHISQVFSLRNIPDFKFGNMLDDSFYDEVLAKDELKKIRVGSKKILLNYLRETKKRSAKLTIRYTFIEFKEPKQKVLSAYAHSGSTGLMREIYKIEENSSGGYKLTPTDVELEVSDIDDSIIETDNARRLKVILKTEIVKRN
jgi:hypothetical protein